MKKILWVCGLFLCIGLIFTKCYSHPSAADAGGSESQLSEETAAYKEPGIVDDITLLYNDGHKVSYESEDMESMLGDSVVLLRNSCMDDDAGCDMSCIYRAMDFAVMNGTTQVVLPLTELQYDTVNNVWRKNHFIRQLYPALNDHAFFINPSDDGRYIIQFEFHSYVADGKDHDENVAEKLMMGRKKAMDIVRSIPDRCANDYQKAEFLYDYISTYVRYYDFDAHGDTYYDSGKEVCLLYDALLENETVCSGYAYAFAYLCELAGIDAQSVPIWTESEKDGLHEVVIAEIDGTACWFDPTWDCGDSKSGFQYFGLSDQDFQTSHAFIDTYYERKLYPICTASLQHPEGYWNFDTMTYHWL